MTTLTVRLPEDKYRRVKEVVQQRGTSDNRLIDEMATLMLAELDAETRFLIRAERGRGNLARGLELLDKSRAKRVGISPRHRKRVTSSK